MTFKLVAIDIDGTLLNSKHQVPMMNKIIIEKLLNKGIHISLITGKHLVSIRELIDILKLNPQTPQITSGGAYVSIPTADKILQAKLLPTYLIRKVEDVASVLGLTIVASDEKGYVTNSDHKTEDIEYMMSFGEPAPRIVDCLGHSLGMHPFHLMIISFYKKHLYHQAAATLNNTFQNSLTVVKSAPYFIDLLHPDASKGEALNLTVKYLNIEMRQVIGFGDSDNDVSFLKSVGYAIAMGNANQNVKKISHTITESCDNNGVALGLKKIFPTILD